MYDQFRVSELVWRTRKGRQPVSTASSTSTCFFASCNLKWRRLEDWEVGVNEIGDWLQQFCTIAPGWAGKETQGLQERCSQNWSVSGETKLHIKKIRYTSHFRSLAGLLRRYRSYKRRLHLGCSPPLAAAEFSGCSTYTGQPVARTRFPPPVVLVKVSYPS